MIEGVKERIFTFGKYRGEKIIGVIRRDPHYVKWANDNLPYFGMSHNEWREYRNVVNRASNRDVLRVNATHRSHMEDELYKVIRDGF